MQMSINGLSLNYEITGQGPCLVLIHGAGDNLGMWYNQVPVFAKEYRVLTYDVRGFGQSEISDGEYTMGDLADDLSQLLKALDIRQACVLGYSRGGMIAMHCAINYPQQVKALILANSGGGAVPNVIPVPALERFTAMTETIRKHGFAPVIDKSTAASFSPSFPGDNPAAFHRYKTVRLQNDPQSYVRAMTLALRTPVDASAVSCPTLIIAGEQDSYMSLETAQKLQRLIPHCQLRIFSTGHAAAIEAPEGFNAAVLEFLRALPD
ncbi:MAG: alpha/beta fold hydrolase [Chloroflexi bacterium]|nr:alpha/beta fold hydrolase [Chloroflexota bacterium]